MKPVALGCHYIDTAHQLNLSPPHPTTSHLSSDQYYVTNICIQSELRPPSSRQQHTHKTITSRFATFCIMNANCNSIATYSYNVSNTDKLTVPFLFGKLLFDNVRADLLTCYRIMITDLIFSRVAIWIISAVSWPRFTYT